MKTSITLRVEADLLSEIRRRASDEIRSQTNFIETLLCQRVAKASLASPPPAKVERSSVTSRTKEKPRNAV